MESIGCTWRVTVEAKCVALTEAGAKWNLMSHTYPIVFGEIANYDGVILLNYRNRQFGSLITCLSAIARS